MTAALLVVDAWKEVLPHDDLAFPYLQQEVELFGKFIRHSIERMSGVTVYNVTSGFEVMDCLSEFPEYDNQQHEKYFFCGFHIGRCLNREYNRLKSSGGVVLNLSLIFPSDEATAMEYDNVPYYWYTHQRGFRLIHVSI